MTIQEKCSKMLWTLLILLVVIPAFGQNSISLKVEKVSLIEFFKAIEKKSDLRFSFINEDIDNEKDISVQVNNENAESLVKRVLSQKGYSYKLTGNTIAVIKNPTPQSRGLKKVSGLVTDEKGDPIIGASVFVKGANAGTITNIDGVFTLDVENQALLSISYVGYHDEQVRVGISNQYKIILKEDTKLLDEVVVVGYGTQKKTSLTGSIATIKGSDIISIKSENITNMLAGKLSGVRVIQTSGEPGAFASTLQIRGMGDPLIIIDGVPRDNMTRIDPNEIENISVLKDASAAIYGVRASNGVILITTKKGEQGKTTIEYSGNYGLQTPINTPVGLNAVQFMEITNENNIMRGSLPFGQLEFSKKEIDKYRNGVLKGTDWSALNSNYYAPQYKHNLSASGSVGKEVDYFLNFSYINQQGIYSTGDLNYERFNLRSNLTAKVTKDIKVELLITGIADTKNSPYNSNENYWRSVLTETPITTAYANNDPLHIQNVSQGFNPLVLSDSEINGYRRNNQKTFQSTGNIIWDIPWLKGLQGKASFSYDYMLWENKSLQKPYKLYNYDAVTQKYSVANYGNTSKLDNSYITRDARFHTNTLMQLSLNYQHTFAKKHNISALVLYEEGTADMDNFSASRYIELTSIEELFGGVNKDQTGSMDGSGYNPNAKPANQSGFWKIANKALIGRVNYDYDSKYYAEFAFRYDGSSKFAPGHQWGFFPSLSAAWRVSEESFIRDNFSDIDNLKIRGSYGVLGDDATATFQFVPGFNYPVNSVDWWPILFNNEPQSLLSLRGTPNTHLTWYTSKSYNLGIDVDFWKGKLGFEGDIFLRNRDGLVASRLVSLPDWLGEQLAGENLNSDQTLGFDMSLKHRNKIGEIYYGIVANLGFTRHRNLYVERKESTNQWENWRNNPTNRYTDIWWGVNSPGQFQNYEEIWSSPVIDGKGNSNFKPGDYKYTDWNEDGVIDDLDLHPLTYGTVNSQNVPMVSFGLTMDVQYKGFDITLVLQGGGFSNVRYEWYLATPFIDNKNGPAFFYDRWHMENPLADPKDPRTKWIPGYLPTTSQGSDAMAYNLKPSNSSIRRSDYLRCKSLELGYTIPSKLIKMIGISSSRVYCNTYNLFTITGLKYLDPEHPSSNYGLIYPLIRTINLGANIKF